MCVEIKKWIPLLFVLFLPLSWAASVIGSVYRWITLTLFGYCLVKNRAKIKIEESSQAIFLSMSILVAYSVISIVWGKSFDESIKSAFSFILMYFVAIVFVSYNYGEDSLGDKLDQFWSIVGIICSILFLFGERAKVGIYGSRTSLKILGTSTDPNEFAGLFAITLAVNVYYIFNSRGSKRNINILAMVVGLYSVLLSGSRGAMVSCVISIVLAVIPCVQVSLKKMLVLLAVAVLLGVVFIRYLLPLIPNDIVARMALQTVLSDGGGGRSTIWRNGLEQYLNSNILRILFGYGANGLIAIGERGSTGAMHNYYLQVLTNFGLIGLCLYFNLLWNVFRKFWICNRKYVPALIAMMALSFTLTTTPNYKPIWILLMTTLIPQRNLNGNEEDDGE